MKSRGCDCLRPIIRHLASVCICFQLICDDEEGEELLVIELNWIEILLFIPDMRKIWLPDTQKHRRLLWWIIPGAFSSLPQLRPISTTTGLLKSARAKKNIKILVIIMSLIIIVIFIILLFSEMIGTATAPPWPPPTPSGALVRMDWSRAPDSSDFIPNCIIVLQHQMRSFYRGLLSLRLGGVQEPNLTMLAC